MHVDWSPHSGKSCFKLIIQCSCPIFQQLLHVWKLVSGSTESGFGGGLLGEEQNRHITAMVTPIYSSPPHPNLIHVEKSGVALVTHLLFYYLIMILLIIIKNKLRDTIIINCIYIIC